MNERPGLTPRGEPMPQTMEEWRHLAGLYADQIEADRKEISELRQENNNLRQKLDKARRIKRLTPPEDSSDE